MYMVLMQSASNNQPETFSHVSAESKIKYSQHVGGRGAVDIPQVRWWGNFYWIQYTAVAQIPILVNISLMTLIFSYDMNLKYIDTFHGMILQSSLVMLIAFYLDTHRS